MRFTFTHSIRFSTATPDTAPYRSTGWWKTSRGALKAAERHALGCEKYYHNVAWHQLTIIDDQGRFVTNMAA